MKLLANLSFRAFSMIKNLTHQTQYFPINVLLSKLVKFMTYCLFMDSTGLLKFSILTMSLLCQLTTFHRAKFSETVQIGFPMTSTHAQCVDYVILTVIAIAVLIFVKPLLSSLKCMASDIDTHEISYRQNMSKFFQCPQ